MKRDGDQVSHVIGILQRGGFQLLAQPIIVGGLPFEFAATMTKDESLELIVVIDTVLEPEAVSLRAQIEGLARALDLVRSRRALTVVLVGPLPEPTVTRELQHVGRVLSVPAGARDGGEPTPEEALAVLLPLELSTAGTQNVGSWASVREELRASYPGSELNAVFKAVSAGESQVRAALHDTLIEPLNRD